MRDRIKSAEKRRTAELTYDTINTQSKIRRKDTVPATLHPPTTCRDGFVVAADECYIAGFCEFVNQLEICTSLGLAHKIK